MDGVLMRRKSLERRSKKYAPVQNVSVGNWYMEAEDFHQKYKTGRVGVKKRMSPAAGGKNRIMIFGPKDDGTYVIEFRTTAGKALAISTENRNRGDPAFSRADAVWAVRARSAERISPVLDFGRTKPK